MELRAKKTCAWAVSALVGTATIGWSVDIKTASGQEADGVLVAGLRTNGAEVMPLGRRGLLEGWLVTPRGKSPYTLYVDESGHGVMGLLFGPDGRELTESQVAAVREAAGRPPGDIGKRSGTSVSKVEPRARALRTLPRAETGGVGSSYRGLLAEKSRVAAVPEGLPQGRRPGAAGRLLPGIFEAAFAVEGFDLGESGPQVAIFADPTCLPSRAAVAELARRALDGGIVLRVVPVGARGADAEVMAALVLGAEDRARTWFTLDREDEWPAPGAEAAAGVALNRKLFERTGSEFVPFALMREPDGRIASAVGADFREWFGDGAAE